MIRVAASSTPLPDRSGQRQTVRVRHAGVQQHQRVRPAICDAVPDGIEGRKPVAPRYRCHVPAAQPLFEDLTVGGIIIDDEHWQVVEQVGQPGCDRLCGGRLAPESRREGERAAPALLALHGDRPAHQGHQPRGDRQAQSSTAVLPRSRSVLLLEGPEDRLLLFARNADAGVAHREAKPGFPVRCGESGGFHSQGHLAFFGKLDGVADQVEQHLAQPGSIAH